MSGAFPQREQQAELGRRQMGQALCNDGSTTSSVHATAMVPSQGISTLASHGQDPVEPDQVTTNESEQPPELPPGVSDGSVQARARWVDYAEAKDEMFSFTDIKEAPWYVVDANDKMAARLNVISHLLDIVPDQAVPHDAVELPPRQQRAYQRPPIDSQTWVPTRFVVR
jgi:hypothetical protein